MKANKGVTYFPFELSSWKEGGYRVNNDDIDSVRASQGFSNIERFLAAIWLRNKKFVKMASNFCNIGWIESVLSIDIGTGSTRFLRIGNDVEG